MKKRIAMFLLLLLCVLSLIGCHTPAQEPDEGDMPVTDDSDAETPVSNTPDADATEPGRVEIDGTVRVELDAAAYDGQGNTLPIRIANATDGDIMYDYAFLVEKKQGDAWVNAMKDPVGFPEPVFVVSSGFVTTRNVNLTSYCEISGAGTYRYCMSIGSGDSVQGYTVEFEVK